MDRKDLAEIKARAGEVKELLQYGPSVQDLLENDVPKLVAEVERLMWQIAQAGKCPHGEFYEDRRCVPCFGDGTEEMLQCSECGVQSWHRGGKCLHHDETAPKPYEPMRRQLEELRSKVVAPGDEALPRAGKCPHGEFYEDRSCVPCFGDGTEEWLKCGECDTHSWHRGGKCLRHDKSAPKPYELLKRQLEEPRSKDRALEQEYAARVEAAQEQVKEIQASRELMRDALEYIKPRLGSMNLGESLAKIARALATVASERATDKDPPSDTAR
jgi:hypothetical protein